MPPRLLQREVEFYFISVARKLNPLYNPMYWMGLKAATHPKFTWTDGFCPGPEAAKGHYLNWGTEPVSGTKEPNNSTNLCGAADYFEATNVTATLTINWAWNDQHCTQKLASMCWRPPRELLIKTLAG